MSNDLYNSCQVHFFLVSDKISSRFLIGLEKLLIFEEYEKLKFNLVSEVVLKTRRCTLDPNVFLV